MYYNIGLDPCIIYSPSSKAIFQIQLQALNQMSSSFKLSIIGFLFIAMVQAATYPLSSAIDSPKATPWPLQFHSTLFINGSGSLSLIDLWYDWPNGRNINIIQNQLSGLFYDVEWNNGSVFTYAKDRDYCVTAHIDVGILRPNWLDGADYLGREMVDGFVSDVWEKVDFIWYYEDVVTKRPVRWDFYTGRSIHVMTFEVGAVLEDVKWQAPAYCFHKNDMTKVVLKSGHRRHVGYFEPPAETI